MTVNTEIIVLHSTKFGENSLIVHTISRSYGRRSFLVRGLGKKVNASLFLPLSILEADVVENPKSTLYTVRNPVAKHPLIGLRSNIRKNAVTMFLSEVLYRVIREETDEQGLFDWCEKEILLLDAIEDGFSNFHIRFLLELSVILGFLPESKDIAPFVGDKAVIMDKFLKSTFEESMLIPLSGEVRNIIAEDLLRYMEFHIESAVNVKSLKVLRELFV